MVDLYEMFITRYGVRPDPRPTPMIAEEIRVREAELKALKEIFWSIQIYETEWGGFIFGYNTLQANPDDL